MENSIKWENLQIYIKKKTKLLSKIKLLIRYPNINQY